MSGLERFSREVHTRGRGSVAEEAAVRYLRRRGYRILERNVTTKAGEIDVVAREGDTLCFIEVKARQTQTYGPAVAAVTPSKQRRLARAASLYLMLRGLGEPPCRFDVLGLDARDGGWEFTLVRDAFQGNG